MAGKQGFAVEFIRLTHPHSGRPLGLVGIDSGDHVYLPATLHPTTIPNADAGRAAFIACHKAQAPVAAFENAFFVESAWLREQLAAPWTHTVNGRTLTNGMLDTVAKSMVEAAHAFTQRRANGKVAGSSGPEAVEVLLDITVENEVQHG